MAGMPIDVVERAKNILTRLEKDQINVENFGSEAELKHGANYKHPEAEKIVNGFDYSKSQGEFSPLSLNRLIDELKELDLDKVTPIDALVKIRQWQLDLKESEAG